MLKSGPSCTESYRQCVADRANRVKAAIAEMPDATDQQIADAANVARQTIVKYKATMDNGLSSTSGGKTPALSLKRVRDKFEALPLAERLELAANAYEAADDADSLVDFLVETKPGLADRIVHRRRDRDPVSVIDLAEQQEQAAREALRLLDQIYLARPAEVSNWISQEAPHFALAAGTNSSAER